MNRNFDSVVNILREEEQKLLTELKKIRDAISHLSGDVLKSEVKKKLEEAPSTIGRKNESPVYSKY